MFFVAKSTAASMSMSISVYLCVRLVLLAHEDVDLHLTINTPFFDVDALH